MRARAGEVASGRKKKRARKGWVVGSGLMWRWGGGGALELSYLVYDIPLPKISQIHNPPYASPTTLILTTPSIY